MNTEGRIDIRLRTDSNRVSGVEIVSGRPFGVSRVFTGKSPEQVLEQLPLLYGVCGIAQTVAAWRACRQAMGEPYSELIGRAHDLLVGCETLREHWMRIQLGWPALMDKPATGTGLQVPVRLLGRIRQFLFAEGEPFELEPSLQIGGDALFAHFKMLSQILEEDFYAMPPAEWIRFDEPEQLDAWINGTDTPAAAFLRFIRDRNEAGLGTSETGMLPPLGNEELNRVFSADVAGAFISRPRWYGVCYETTVLSRQLEHPLIEALIAQRGRGLLVRAVARLLELGQMPVRLNGLLGSLRHEFGDDGAGDLPAGVGIGQVEAARGRLVHRVELDDGRVERYQILAPTEWNFHPEGTLATGLTNLGEGDSDELRRRAAILIEAVDPCAPWYLDFSDA